MPVLESLALAHVQNRMKSLTKVIQLNPVSSLILKSGLDSVLVSWETGVLLNDVRKFIQNVHVGWRRSRKRSRKKTTRRGQILFRVHSTRRGRDGRGPRFPEPGSPSPQTHAVIRRNVHGNQLASTSADSCVATKAGPPCRVNQSSINDPRTEVLSRNLRTGGCQRFDGHKSQT